MGVADYLLSWGVVGCAVELLKAGPAWQVVKVLVASRLVYQGGNRQWSCRIESIVSSALLANISARVQKRLVSRGLR